METLIHIAENMGIYWGIIPPAVLFLFCLVSLALIALDTYK